jgi:hypothetical protein
MSWHSVLSHCEMRVRNSCRYTLKNKDLQQEGWGVMYACGGCAEDDSFDKAFLAHTLACKKQIHVGKVNLKPTTTARSIVQFRAKQCRPRMGNHA